MTKRSSSTGIKKLFSVRKSVTIIHNVNRSKGKCHMIILRC